MREQLGEQLVAQCEAERRARTLGRRLERAAASYASLAEALKKSPEELAAWSALGDIPAPEEVGRLAAEYRDARERLLELERQTKVGLYVKDLPAA